MVRDAQLSLILEATLELQEKADRLVQTANNQGGRDNISVVLVQVAEAPRQNKQMTR
jgi:protein phosphatase